MQVTQISHAIVVCYNYHAYEAGNKYYSGHADHSCLIDIFADDI